MDGFRKRIASDDFIEWEEVYPGQYYGTLKSEVDRIWSEGKAVIFDVDVYGGINLKKAFGMQALSIFVKPPSIEMLRQRLRVRNTESEEKIEMRMRKARQELNKADEFDLVVLNDELKVAIETTKVAVMDFLKQ